MLICFNASIQFSAFSNKYKIYLQLSSGTIRSHLVITVWRYENRKAAIRRKKFARFSLFFWVSTIDVPLFLGRDLTFLVLTKFIDWRGQF